MSIKDVEHGGVRNIVAELLQFAGDHPATPAFVFLSHFQDNLLCSLADRWSADFVVSPVRVIPFLLFLVSVPFQ